MNRPYYKFFLWLSASFYILAGCNHFISAPFYYGIMPEWLPAHSFLIFASGVIEIFLGISLLFKASRKLAALLIILMLLAFIPVHIDMISKAPFSLGKLKITVLIAWIRIPLQFLLICWAWYYYRENSSDPGQQNQI